MKEVFPCSTNRDAMTQQGLSTDSLDRTLLNAWLARLSPQQILRWTIETFGSRLVMTSAFGLNGVALIHMVQAIDLDIPVVFVDTGYLFEETIQTKRKIERVYGVRVLTYRPILNGKKRMDYNARPGLADHRPDICCTRRKVEPMQRAMAELQPEAVLNARSRFQSVTRQGLPVVEWDQTPLRINPLVDWSKEQVRTYIDDNAIPYNPLHDAGYPSIGCRPCTRPVLAGEDLRSGRWSGSAKKECGLWTRAWSGNPGSGR